MDGGGQHVAIFLVLFFFAQVSTGTTGCWLGTGRRGWRPRPQCRGTATTMKRIGGPQSGSVLDVQRQMLQEVGPVGPSCAPLEAPHWHGRRTQLPPSRSERQKASMTNGTTKLVKEGASTVKEKEDNASAGFSGILIRNWPGEADAPIAPRGSPPKLRGAGGSSSSSRAGANFSSALGMGGNDFSSKC